jgi:hypothetical protein
MITPELLDFIEAELKAGQTHDGLFKLLHEGGGWTDEDMKEAFDTLEKRKNQHPISVAEMRAKSVPANTPMLHIPVSPPPVAPPPPPKHEPARIGEMLGQHIDAPAYHPTIPTPEGNKSVTPPPTQPLVEIPLSFSAGAIHADAQKSVVAPPPTTVEKHAPSVPLGEIISPQGLSASITPASSPLPTAQVTSKVSSPTPTPFPSVAPSPAVISFPEKTSPASVSLGASLRLKASSSKKILIGVGVIIFIALFGVGGYFVFTGLTPKADKVFATMYASIPGIQSLRYSGESTLNFSGKVSDPLAASFPEGYTGSAKVALKYDGRTDLTQGIDGVHQFGITADLRSGESAITVNSTVEVRIIGDTYYIKVTNPPEIKDIDLSRLNTYWIAVSPSDIVERFGGTLTGGKADYGAFGGASSTPTVRGFLSVNPPFDAVDRVGEEKVGGADTVHYRFKGNPENMLGLLRFLAVSVTGSPWEMTEQESVNVKALLKNVAGDIWIDTVSYLPRKIVFRQPLKGVVSGITLDGALDVEQSYGEYNGPVAVSVPRPVITYAEFADNVKSQAARAKATGDARRVFDAEDIVSALEVYRANNNDRYPLTLDELVTSGLLKTLPVDPDGGAYLYTPYTTKGMLGKKFICTASSPTCTFFHLGITLTDPKNEVLKTDSDLTSETISGADAKGCAKEAGKTCYDLTPAPK